MRSSIVLVVLLSFLISGCAVAFYKSNPKDKDRIGQLSSEVERLKKLKEEEARQLQSTMDALERELKQEIDEKQVRLEMAERGLVITFVDEILFDSGKTEVRAAGKDALDKVVTVLKEKKLEQNIGVEGHTDNEPIKHSGWKSNWELSTTRATAVLHHLVSKGISPRKLSATGYGEYHPVASNDTLEGRQKNRRVEVVILPKYAKAKAKTMPVK